MLLFLIYNRFRDVSDTADLLFGEKPWPSFDLLRFLRALFGFQMYNFFLDLNSIENQSAGVNFLSTFPFFLLRLTEPFLLVSVNLS